MAPFKFALEGPEPRAETTFQTGPRKACLVVGRKETLFKTMELQGLAWMIFGNRKQKCNGFMTDPIQTLDNTKTPLPINAETLTEKLQKYDTRPCCYPTIAKSARPMLKVFVIRSSSISGLWRVLYVRAGKIRKLSPKDC